MLSKQSQPATAVLLLTLVLQGCSLQAPWQHERPNEVNVAFSFEKNVIVVQADVEEQPRTFIVGSGTPRSVLNGNGRSLPVKVTFGGKTRIVLRPERLTLPDIADGILGADAWNGTALTIDYARKLLTIDLHQQTRSDARAFPFQALPVLPITVDGRHYDAVVDTSSPDTLTIPSREKKRAMGAVTVGDEPLGRVDYQLASVSEARIGNRLLSRYLLTIDYARGRTYIWNLKRESTAPLRAPN